MFRNFKPIKPRMLGYDVAWIAESHLSSQVQKQNRNPVIPHWNGEVASMWTFFNSHKIFNVRVGLRLDQLSRIFCAWGLSRPRRVSAFLALHGPGLPSRKINVGFAAGRFNFMNGASGCYPKRMPSGRRSCWKGKVFAGQQTSSCDSLNEKPFHQMTSRSDQTRSDFRSDEQWQAVVEAYGQSVERIPVTKQWEFESLRCPQDWRKDLLSLIIGSRPCQQDRANELLPVKVFNLSITKPEVIDATHDRMREAYHPDGGGWTRACMPRTVFVFVNGQSDKTPEAQSAAARQEAEKALGAYWTALEGTLDPSRVTNAANNALIGNPDEVAQQVVERFHPDDG